MKQVLLLAVSAVIIISGCKEKPPLIIFSTPKYTDSTYIMTPAPSATAHQILVEEFTGASCSNCPVAHDALVSLAQNNPNRINIICLHPKDYPQAAPETQPGARLDFRQQKAEDIEMNIYQPLYAMPLAGFDRMPLGAGSTGPSTPLQCLTSIWGSNVSTLLPTADSINLSVQSSFSGGTATIVVTTTYLYNTYTAQNLSLAIVEDSLRDVQEDGLTFDTGYHFDFVFRDLVTADPFGDPILVSLPFKEAGRTDVRTYTYQLNAAWNAANCRIVAFVHRSESASGANVYQSAQARIAP